MSTPGFVSLPPTLITELQSIVGIDNVVTEGSSLETLSKDFYWYSPVLRDRIGDRLASAAVRVKDLDQLKRIAALAFGAGVPITPRGAATGNYGQAVPLFGGLVIDLSAFDRILDISDGVVTAEPGARIVHIENQARPLGFEMRCYPSTWVKSTVAGFLCGGSGGIGSISWGGLREPGMIKRLKVLTVSAEPEIITLEETDTLRAFHAYGTNGIIVEVQLRLAPARPWEQLVVTGTEWEPLLTFANKIANDPTIPKRLVSVMENPIGSFFKPIKKFYPEDHHLIFFEVDETVATEVVTRAVNAGLGVSHRIPYHYPRKAPMLSDYTWNHTTLWALKSDSAWTYLQCGFSANHAEQFRMVHAKFPGEILFHLELTRSNPTTESPATAGVGGIPLVNYKSEERLREIIDYCRSIGIGVANPHSCYIEEGGRDSGYEIQLELKERADPAHLLNPGKMRCAALPASVDPEALPHFLYS